MNVDIRGATINVPDEEASIGFFFYGSCTQSDFNLKISKSTDYKAGTIFYTSDTQRIYTYVSDGWIELGDVGSSEPEYEDDLNDYEMVSNCTNCGAPLHIPLKHSGDKFKKTDTCKCIYCGTTVPLFKRRFGK